MQSSIFHLKKKGFTLIELLVVISIISLLSSIIFASTQTTRERARLSSAMVFSSSLFQALGADAEASFDFNEGSGSSLVDSSGEPHVATLINNPVWDTDTPKTDGTSLTFNGIDQYITINGPVTVPEKFTLAAWVKIPSGHSGLHMIFNNRLTPFVTGSTRFGINGGKVLISNNTQPVSGYLGNAQVNDGKWHHVAWSSNGIRSTIYVDGKTDFSVDYITPENTETVGHIGTNNFGSYFKGSMDDFQLYTHPVIE